MFLTKLLALDLDPVQIVDKAATATDRWLFLAAMVFIIIAFLVVIRYLVKARDTENNQHQTWVETVYTENVKLTANVLVVLQETNALLRRLDEHLLRREGERP